MNNDTFSAWTTGRQIIIDKTAEMGLKFKRIIKIADNCSQENKSQYRLAELKEEPLPITLVFKVQGWFRGIISVTFILSEAF